MRFATTSGQRQDTWSTSQTLGVAGNNQSPSQLFFSNSGAYLAYVALLPNSSSTQIQLVNALSGKLLFTSSALSWVTVAGTGDDQFGVASFGFSSDYQSTRSFWPRVATYLPTRSANDGRQTDSPLHRSLRGRC
jgi:hypothetical protein